jgi:hypothetical protein
MGDQQISVGAVWSRIPLPHAPYSASAPRFDLWIWHQQQPTPTQLTQELRAQLRKQGWKRLPASKLEQIFCLRGQLLPVRTMEAKTGNLEYWANQTDIEHVNAVPVALAFSLPEGMSVDLATTNLSVNDPLPPTRIGEVGLIVEGNKAIPYTIDILGPQEQELWKQLGALIISLSSSQTFLDSLSPIPEELPFLTQQLAIAYYKAHRARTTSVRALVESPNIFQAASEVPIPIAIPIQGVLAALSNAASGAPGWEHRSDRVPRYTYRQGEATTKVELRSSTAIPSPDQRTILSLWKKVRTFGDLDGDVFLILLAQAMSAQEAGAIPEEPNWAVATKILDYRGLKPIVKKELSASGASIIERQAGHRTEDVVSIAECIDRLENTWVTIRQMIETPPKSGRGKTRSRLYQHESRLIVIDERMRQKQLRPDEELAIEDLEPFDGSEDNTLIAVAWRYRLGTWITPFLANSNRQMAWLCQQALKYNPEKELLEKRLARYFLFHLRIYAAQTTQTIVRTIQTLFNELTLPTDGRNPERTRQRFEKALDRLVKDHQIDEWSYLEENPPLPKSGWLPIWLSWKMRFSATPPTIIEEKVVQSELFPL